MFAGLTALGQITAVDVPVKPVYFLPTQELLDTAERVLEGLGMEFRLLPAPPNKETGVCE